MEGFTPERQQSVSPERIEKRHEELSELLQDARAVKAMRDALWTKANEGLTKDGNLRAAGAHLAALRVITDERFLERDEERVVEHLRELFMKHIEKGDDLLALSAAADAISISGEDFLERFSTDEARKHLQEELRKVAHAKEKLVAARAAADYRVLFKSGALDAEEDRELAKAFDVPIARAIEQRQDFVHAGVYAADRKILLNKTESVIQ